MSNHDSLYVDFVPKINMLKVETLLKLASYFVLASNIFDKEILSDRKSVV